MKTVVTRPYEFLVRWRNGAISGAHVGFEDAIVEDGNTVSTTPNPVTPVDIGQGNGFPLSDILGTIEIDALARVAALEAELAEKISIINALTQKE